MKPTDVNFFPSITEKAYQKKHYNPYKVNHELLEQEVAKEIDCLEQFLADKGIFSGFLYIVNKYNLEYNRTEQEICRVFTYAAYASLIIGTAIEETGIDVTTLEHVYTIVSKANFFRPQDMKEEEKKELIELYDSEEFCTLKTFIGECSKLNTTCRGMANKLGPRKVSITEDALNSIVGVYHIARKIAQFNKFHTKVNIK